MNQSWYIRALSLLVCALAYGAGAAAEDGKAQPAPSAVAQKQDVSQLQIQPNAVVPAQANNNAQAIAEIAEALGDMPGGPIEQKQIIRASDAILNEVNAE